MFTKTVGNDTCGLIFPMPGVKGMGVALYNGTGAKIYKGQVMMWEFDEVVNQEEQAAAVATSTSVLRRAVVALEDIADKTIGKFQYKGDGLGRVDDTAEIAAGRYLEVLNSASEFNDDGASHTVESVALLKEAVAADESGGDGYVLKKVYLFGEPHQIKAT